MKDDGKPIERLVEYIMCESITGGALCEDIQQSCRNLQLNLHNTMSQTYDGAANFSGHIKGCAAPFQKSVSPARYFHCSNHDLNLALCHPCKDVQEIRNMLGCVTEIGLFFKYSPKRAQLLEGTIKQENIAKDPDNRMSTTKIKLFCETRWIERHVELEEMYDLYDPLLKTLHKINTEYGWDNKTADAAYSLMKSITDPTFIVALNVCSYSLVFTKLLSAILQATSMGIIKAYTSINLIQSQLKTL